MTARIAILTPDPADEAWLSRWQDVLEREAAPLRAAGMEVEGRTWAEAGNLAAFEREHRVLDERDMLTARPRRHVGAVRCQAVLQALVGAEELGYEGNGLFTDAQCPDNPRARRPSFDLGTLRWTSVPVNVARRTAKAPNSGLA